MNDKDLKRKFGEIERHFERVENAKAGEPVLGSELYRTLKNIDDNISSIKIDFGALKERVDNHIKFFWAVCVGLLLIAIVELSILKLSVGFKGHLQPGYARAERHLRHPDVGPVKGRNPFRTSLSSKVSTCQNC
jgi:hypothetical protein